MLRSSHMGKGGKKELSVLFSSTWPLFEAGLDFSGQKPSCLHFKAVDPEVVDSSEHIMLPQIVLYFPQLQRVPGLCLRPAYVRGQTHLDLQFKPSNSKHKALNKQKPEAFIVKYL